jgi:hypothetical protein
MTPPNPRVLDRKLTDLGNLCVDLLRAGAQVRDPYRWAYGIGLAPTVADGGGGTQVDYSDPTLAVVESPSKARTRAACVAAVRALDDAANAVKEAIALVDGAQNGLSKLLPRPGAWSTVQAEHRGKELDSRLGRGRSEGGSFLAQGEYEESLERQRARGQGFGER